MNEFWQCEDGSSFCFCSDGEWYQTKKNEADPSEWIFCSVVMDQGLPVEMHENDYDEIDLGTMLDVMEWSEEELESQIQSQLNQID